MADQSEEMESSNSAPNVDGGFDGGGWQTQNTRKSKGKQSVNTVQNRPHSSRTFGPGPRHGSNALVIIIEPILMRAPKNRKISSYSIVQRGKIVL